MIFIDADSIRVPLELLLSFSQPQNPEFGFNSFGKLLIDFLVEDPDYLAEPFAGTMEWDYAPNLEFIGIDCDPEVSTRPWGDLGSPVVTRVDFSGLSESQSRLCPCDSVDERRWKIEWRELH